MLTLLPDSPRGLFQRCAQRPLAGQRGARYGAFHIFAVDDLRVFPIKNSRMTLQETADLGDGAAVAAFAIRCRNERLCFAKGNNGLQATAADST